MGEESGRGIWERNMGEESERGIWEESGHPEGAQEPPEGTQEAPKRHPRGTMGTQETPKAPRRPDQALKEKCDKSYVFFRQDARDRPFYRRGREVTLTISAACAQK